MAIIRFIYNTLVSFLIYLVRAKQVHMLWAMLAVALFHLPTISYIAAFAVVLIIGAVMPDTAAASSMLFSGLSLEIIAAKFGTDDNKVAADFVAKYPTTVVLIGEVLSIALFWLFAKAAIFFFL